MINSETLRKQIENIMRTKGVPMTTSEIHKQIIGMPVTPNRVAVMLRSMVAIGAAYKTGKKSAPMWHMAAAKVFDESGMSDAMKAKAEIYEFKPLVSATRFAPTREVPEWSRQPL